MRHYQVRDVMTANPMTVTPARPSARWTGSSDVESQLGYAIDDIRLPRVPVAGLLTVNVRIGGSGDPSHPAAGPSSL